MANPQAENGHTDIAHEVLEALMKTPLSGAEFRVLLAILRKTWGWHKKQDTLSLNQIAELTGIPRRTVIRASGGLLEKRILDREERPRSPSTWRINKDYEQWVVSKVAPSVKSGTPPSVKSGTLQKKLRQKKRKKPPISPRGGLNGFDEFYLHYPRKVAKEAARKAWKKIKPNTALAVEITDAIKTQVAADHFRGTDGQCYTPYPATWLNAGRWEDEIQKPTEKKDKYW